MQHTAANAAQHNENKVRWAYSLTKKEREYYPKHFKGNYAYGLAECQRKLGTHMLKHGLPGVMPMAVARDVLAKMGCAEQTAGNRLQALLGTPFFTEIAGQLCLRTYPILHGGPKAAQLRKEILQQRAREGMAARRAKAKTGVNKIAATPPPGALQANVNHHLNITGTAGSRSCFFLKNKHPASLRLPQAAAAQSKALLPAKSIPTRPGRALRGQESRQATTRPALAALPPAPASRQASTQPAVAAWLPKRDPELDVLIGKAFKAWGKLPTRPATPLAAPPRAVAPKPAPAPRPAPPKAATGVLGVPAAYAWQRLDRVWFEQFVRTRKGMEGANYWAFAAQGASTQLLLDALHLVETATQKIINRPGALYRACQRLQAGVFVMRQWPTAGQNRVAG